jgi:hypothetical protein
MKHPIVIKPLGGNMVNVRVHDGSDGLVGSGGLVADAETALSIVSGLLGVTNLEAEGQPWAQVYAVMKERVAE